MVLTGVPEDGALHFTLDKTVVAPNDDCETTDSTSRPSALTKSQWNGARASAGARS